MRLTQVPHSMVKMIEAPSNTSRRLVRLSRRYRRAGAMLYIKYSDLTITSTGDERCVIRVWHELDREYVCCMPCSHGCGKGEACRRGFGLVFVDIQMLIITTRCQQSSRGRPAAAKLGCLKYFRASYYLTYLRALMHPR